MKHFLSRNIYIWITFVPENLNIDNTFNFKENEKVIYNCYSSQSKTEG